MSPKPVNFDRVVDELRQERPTGIQRRQALEALSRPNPHRWRIATVTAAGLCVAGGAFLMVPSRGSGTTWSDVVRRMKDTKHVHTLTFDGTGKKRGEMWRSGPYYAMVTRDTRGRLVGETRRDATTLYFYIALRPLELPNAYYYGQLFKVSEGPSQAMAPSNTIESLLTDRRTTLISRQTGTVDRYRVRTYGSQTATVEVEPASGRILQIRRGNGETDKFDYPPSIAPEVFSYRSRVSQDVPVLDARTASSDDPIAIPKPLASRDGVQLREVQLVPDGDLFVTWTGEKYSRTHKRPFRVVGIRTDHPRYGPGPYVDGRRREDRLTVVKLALRQRIGERISIQIPTGPSTTVEFRNVPVRRLRPLR